MRLVLNVCALIAVMAVSACGHKGVYSKGYYSGRGTQWPRATHVVKAGETLYSIAWQYGQDYRQIALWNGIDSTYTIYPQQELKVVKPQKTLRPVAKDGTKFNKQANRPATKSNIKKPVVQARKVRTVSQKLAWQWPARGKILSRFSANDPGQKGIDIKGQAGQSIYAAEKGHVVYSGSGLRGYGKLIIVKHNETFLSAYAHNEKLRVREGQKVKKGEHIADMGKTGTETVQLHFEIRRNGIPVNPFKYLPKQ